MSFEEDFRDINKNEIFGSSLNNKFWLEKEINNKDKKKNLNLDLTNISNNTIIKNTKSTSTSPNQAENNENNDENTNSCITPSFMKRTKTIFSGKKYYSNLDLNEEDENSVKKKIELLKNDKLGDKRSQSFLKIDVDNKGFQEELEKRLKIVKKQTEEDTLIFQSELNEMKTPNKETKQYSEFEEIYKNLQEITKKIINISLQDLKIGGSIKIMLDLQNLDKMSAKNKDCRKMVRKLIFIFSRCSRLIEYMVFWLFILLEN
jgi:hypothetical protein